VVIGVKDHLEVWNPGTWRQRLEANVANQGEIMLRAREALGQHLKRNRQAREE